MTRSTKPLRTPLTAAVALAATGLALAAAAQDKAAELPPAEEILQRSVDATGSPEAMKDHQNRVRKGRVVMPSAGFEAQMTIYQARPNKMLAVMESPMFGRIEQGFDGKVAWSRDPMQGPRRIEGSQLEQLLLDADFDGGVDFRKHFAKMETVGRTTFEGMDAYEVRMETGGGLEVTGFFSVDTGLQVGMRMMAQTPMGEAPTTTVMTDYADFHGMKIPKKTVMKMIGMEQVLTVDEVLVNVPDIPSFDAPEEVLAAPSASDPPAPGAP